MNNFFFPSQMNWEGREIQQIHYQRVKKTGGGDYGQARLGGQREVHSSAIV